VIDRAKDLVHAFEGEKKLELQFDKVLGFYFLGVSKLSRSMILNEFLGKSVFEGELIHNRVRCEDYCGGSSNGPEN
jgi:hypothetical protein